MYRTDSRPQPELLQRVAVVGSGIAGLAAAWSLRDQARLTLYEAGDHFGGHVHTVDACVDGLSHPVDTGFLVLNRRTYPGLLELFAELGIELAESDMSFSVQRPRIGGGRLEWSGASLDTVFAQRSNLLRPRFWGMLGDILRFHREATAVARCAEPAQERRSVGEFLRQRGYGRAFVHDYLLPMIACIWSCPPAQMLEFPLLTLVRFCDNHGLLQVENRPQWLTVRGGARRYVQRMVERLPDARLRAPVLRVKRHEVGVEVSTATGTEWYDQVILACHSDQALAMLVDADAEERGVLGAIGYQRNRAVLHTDSSLLPRQRKAWAAWNFESGTASGEDAHAPAQGEAVCLHYLLNRLQPVPFERPVLVSLNPLREPHPSTVLREIDYAHPVFDAAAIAAQPRVAALQGRRRTYFCGAWCGHGFHEDGLRAGQAAARAWTQRQHRGAHSPATERVAA